MQTIYIIIKAFLQLCLFKYKPQDFPASVILLIMVLAVYMLLSGMLAPVSLSAWQRFLWSFSETGLLVVSVTSLLLIIKHSRRILQTLIALAGANSLLSLFSVPFVIWLDQGENYNLDLAIPTIILLILMFWSIAVHVHVLRHALNVSPFTALVITIILLSFIGTILLSLFPEIKL